MDQSQINQQILAIWQLLQQNFEHGASIEEISAFLPFDMERRTLQRRLDMLQQQGALTVSGKTKATRYFPASDTYRPKPRQEYSPVKFDLSSSSALALRSVSQPLDRRNRVNVNPFFLESYRPNIDTYFTEAERRQLHGMGRTKFAGTAPGTYAKGVMQVLLSDLSYNCCRLEGSFYSREQVETLYTTGEFAGQSTDLENQMSLNHKDAIEFIMNGGDDIRFDRYTLTNLHAMLSNNLILDDARAGKLRTQPAIIPDTTYVAASMASQIEERFSLILEKASQISDPFEQAFFMMVHLPYLQAFTDMNLAVSRLASNISLMRNNLMPLTFQDVPADHYNKAMISVYELNRIDLLKEIFMYSYERSCNRYAQVKHKFGEPDPLRIRYREEIRSAVFNIVNGNMIPEEAGEYVAERSSAMSQWDRLRFHELIQKELSALHDGNIARYWIRPSELLVWRTTWETGVSDNMQTSKVLRMSNFMTVASR